MHNISYKILPFRTLKVREVRRVLLSEEWKDFFLTTLWKHLEEFNKVLRYQRASQELFWETIEELKNFSRLRE